MLSSMDPGEGLSLVIEKSSKPLLKVSERGHSVKAHVPSDVSQNWPSYAVNLFSGYVVRLQKLQQQFKITIEHEGSRKPECVIGVGGSKSGEFKPVIKEMNTFVGDLHIAAESLDITGVVKARRLTLEASKSALHVGAKIDAQKYGIHLINYGHFSLSLLGENVFVVSEALINTAALKMVGSRVQLDGKVFPAEERTLCVEADCSLLHIGVDGAIGSTSDKDAKKDTKEVTLRVGGCLANYGHVSARERVNLTVSGSLLSLSDGSIDSAGRSYDALKRIRGVQSETNSEGAPPPSSNILAAAISARNVSAVAQLIESGVDPRDRTGYQESARKTAARLTHEKRRDGAAALVNALLAVREWRRGRISARKLRVVVNEQCLDLAQLYGRSRLRLKVGGRAVLEPDSIWTSGEVHLQASELELCGQAKLVALDANVGGAVLSEDDAIVSVERNAKVVCALFDSGGIWSVLETFRLQSTSDLHFRGSSHSEAEAADFRADGDCGIAGVFQINSLWLACSSVSTTVSGRVHVDSCGEVQCDRLFQCSGTWKSVDLLQLKIGGSAHFAVAAHVEARELRVECRDDCVLGGRCVASQLLSLYVRDEAISLATSTVLSLADVHITAGAFRNGGSWQANGDLELRTGVVEQSEDASLVCGRTLSVFTLSSAPSGFDGHLLAGRIILRPLHELVIEGEVKAVEMEVYLPYIDTSQLTIRGSVLLSGCLIAEGNSSFEDLAETALPRASLLICGQVEAVALVAPFLCAMTTPNSVLRLSGLECQDLDFLLALHVGAFYTSKDAMIEIVKNFGDGRAQGIIVATTWSHLGKVLFQADSARIFTNSLINSGIFTCRREGVETLLPSLRISVDGLLLNAGNLTAQTLVIEGRGQLDNRGKLVGEDDLQILLQSPSSQLSPASTHEEHCPQHTRVEERLSGLSAETTDVGYASRSSSEDLNRSPRYVESPKSWHEEEAEVIIEEAEGKSGFEDFKENFLEDVGSLDTQLLFCGEERLRLAPLSLKRLERRLPASPTKSGHHVATPNHDLAFKRFMLRRVGSGVDVRTESLTGSVDSLVSEFQLPIPHEVRATSCPAQTGTPVKPKRAQEIPLRRLVLNTPTKAHLTPH